MSRLGTSSIKFSSISDKVSDEILQCGIDYFSHFRDSDTDPGGLTMDLFRKANSLAVGNIAKQRCKENSESLIDWARDKPEREKQKRIEVDFKALKFLLDEFENKRETIENAKELISRSNSRLLNIKSILGSTDDIYLKLSTRVASQAQSFVVEEINITQDYIIKQADSTHLQFQKAPYFLILKAKLEEAWQTIILISTLDMESGFRINRFNKNKESLKSICMKLEVNIPGSLQTTTSTAVPKATVIPKATIIQKAIPATTTGHIRRTNTKGNNDDVLTYLPIIIIVISTLIGASIGGSDGSAAGGGLAGFLTGCVLSGIVSWINKLSK